MRKGNLLRPGQSLGDIAAVVLAAGRSMRMGKQNKLLKDVGGKPLIRRAVEQIAASNLSQIAVVVGHESANVRQALNGLKVSFVENPAYRDGLSSSLRCGIEALGGKCDGALIVLGDMPHIGPAIINKLISAFSREDGRTICIPTFNGIRGNPVLWGAEFFPAMQKLEGDVGAKCLLGEFEEHICEVAMDDRSVLIDLDTPLAFKEYAAR